MLDIRRLQRLSFNCNRGLNPAGISPAQQVLRAAGPLNSPQKPADLNQGDPVRLRQAVLQAAALARHHERDRGAQQPHREGDARKDVRFSQTKSPNAGQHCLCRCRHGKRRRQRSTDNRAENQVHQQSVRRHEFFTLCRQHLDQWLCRLYQPQK